MNEKITENPQASRDFILTKFSVSAPEPKAEPLLLWVYFMWSLLSQRRNIIFQKVKKGVKWWSDKRSKPLCAPFLQFRFLLIYGMIGPMFLYFWWTDTNVKNWLYPDKCQPRQISLVFLQIAIKTNDTGKNWKSWMHQFKGVRTPCVNSPFDYSSTLNSWMTIWRKKNE